MFGHWTYTGYTLLFCLPALIMMWLRQEFFHILRRRRRAILLAAFSLTLYGSLIWPIALHYGAWAYDDSKILQVKLFSYVYVDDVIWWLVVSLTIASFVALSREHEQRGIDIFAREVRELVRSFLFAFRGVKTITLERNSTVHVAVATFVVLEGILFNISTVEWIMVLFAIGSILALEMMNTAIERLASKMQPEYDQDIRLIKDTAAAGVLLASIAVAIIGGIIFFSRILRIIFF